MSIEMTPSETNLLHNYQPTKSETSNIASNVLFEVAQLQHEGFDVALTDTPDEFRPSVDQQDQIDAEVARLEKSPLGAEEFRSHAGIKSWAPLTKRAVALHTLYNPMSKTVGEGIDPMVYDRPLFNGMSANELLRVQMPDKAQRYIDAYQEFVPAEIESDHDSGITSRDFFRGVKDAESVRTRATAAMEMVSDHIDSQYDLADSQKLVSASLACGAAGPVYKMVQSLERRGHSFEDVVLVDQDPMALATAQSIAENNGVSDKVRLELRNLVTEPLDEYLEKESVDVVDLLGLFEYFPAEYAAMLLSKVKEIVKPGGYIVFGNMLNERPQQDFFSKVVDWPKLCQRSISEVQSVVANAGFDPRNMQVRIPSEGVYAVYGIQVPAAELNETTIDTSVAQELGNIGITHSGVEQY